MDEEADNVVDSPFFNYIESCLRHKSETVVYEAAHAIVNLRKITARDLAPSVSVLQLFCTSPKASLRFAAARTLNKVSTDVANFVVNRLDSPVLELHYFCRLR